MDLCMCIWTERQFIVLVYIDSCCCYFATIVLPTWSEIIYKSFFTCVM